MLPQVEKEATKMGQKLTQHFSIRKTPQHRQAVGKTQVKNDAGGYVFEISDFDRLNRFLILGSDKGTYYASEQKLTVDNAQCVLRCLKEDGQRVVDTIVDVSCNGRAVRNDSALFALALAASQGNAETQRAALTALPQVARIGTHLFQFAQYVSAMRGWGPALRRAVATWYNSMDTGKLAYQVVKYPQRVTEQGVSVSKWSHRDLLRKSHAVGDAKHNRIYDYVCHDGKLPSRLSADLKILRAAQKMQEAESAAEVVSLIEEYDEQRLPHELVPKQFASDPSVWRALLPNMPLTATIRTLGRLTSYGVLAPGSQAVKDVARKLKDEEYIRKSRIHPLSLLIAMKTYSQGRGMKGNMSWSPDRKITDALDDAFYMAFGNVEPTGKRLMLALDVSGSMYWSSVAGIDNLLPAEAAAVMSMVTARVEDDYEIMGFGTTFAPLKISPRQRFDDVLNVMKRMNMGGTDCSLPMQYAMKNKMDLDGFVVYTDGETWAGNIHPFEALKRYRGAFVTDAKLAVVATTASGTSIADPSDAGMLDVAGFSTDAPNVISSFLRGDF